MIKKISLINIYIIALILFFISCKNQAGKGAHSDDQKVVTVLGAVTDDELSLFEGCFVPFEKETGITVNYQPTKEFESLLRVRVEQGNPPDVAMVPQPGLAAKFIKDGKVVKMRQKTVHNIKKNYSAGWIDLMSYEGSIYGVVHSVNLKSIVIYPKKAWEKAGWKVPTTWEELEELCEQMVLKGEHPWAAGIESGTATGWPATDWIEDIMLRTAGPEKYDRWAAGELKFSSPEVKRAFTYLERMWLTPGYVYGGTAAIAATSADDGAKVLFEDPPKAWMYRQGNYIVSFLPDHAGNNVDEEVGVFAFPPIDPEYGTPVLIAGQIFYAFTDKPEVHDFMHYASTGKSTEYWAKSGGALFPHNDQNMDNYPTKFSRNLASILKNASVLKFDASDRMPPEVGARSFWNQMVHFVDGKDIDRVLSDIDSSWPEQY